MSATASFPRRVQVSLDLWPTAAAVAKNQGFNVHLSFDSTTYTLTDGNKIIVFNAARDDGTILDFVKRHAANRT